MSGILIFAAFLLIVGTIAYFYTKASDKRDAQMAGKKKDPDVNPVVAQMSVRNQYDVPVGPKR